jgi:hypothetical protein
MTRRKREIAGLANERDFPYLVELALPPGGFRSVFQEFDTSSNHSIFDSASQMPPLRMHSAIASVA